MKATKRFLLLSCLLALSGCGTSIQQRELEAPDEPDEVPPPGPGALHMDESAIGSGEVFSLLAADFDGDGNRELAVGARRFLMLENDGSERFHLESWNRPERPFLIHVGWTWDMVAIPSEDGGADLLISDSHGQAYLVDPSTGDIRWQRELDQVWGFAYLDVFGPNDEPVLFPLYGNAAYSVRTGEKLWDSPLPNYHSYGKAMRAGTGKPTDLVVGIEIDWKVGEDSETVTARRKGSDIGQIHRISPEGELRWSYELPPGEQPVALGTADLDGEGEDSILVFRFGGMLTVLHPDGTLRWEKQFDYYGPNPSNTFVDEILSRDVDGDGKDELFLIFRNELYRPRGFGPSKVVALDTEGNELWQYDFDEHVNQAVIEDIAGKPTLLLASGSRHVDRYGVILALDLSPDAGQRLRKRFQPPFQARAVAWFQKDGMDHLAVGSMDGRLRTVEYESGNWLGDRSLGQSIMSTAAVERPQGDDWVATGDQFGDIRMIDEEGTLRWHRRLEVGKYGGITDLHAASLREPGDGHLLATAFSWDATRPRGLLEVFSAQGAKILEAGFDAEAHTVTTADLDGDGRPEILVGVGIRSEADDCRIIALDGVDGHVIWERPVVTCDHLELTPGEKGPHGTEIVVRADPGLLPVPPFVGLLEPDGHIRWLVEEVREISLWSLSTPAGPIFGGAAYGNMGYVTLRDREFGTIVWQTHTEPVPNPLMPKGDPITGAPRYGVLAPDRDGDGIPEIAMATAAKQVTLVDGATGALLWTTQTEPLDTPFALQHSAGPLVLAPATETTEALIVATQAGTWLSEASVFGISLDGELRNTVAVPAATHDLTVVKRSSGISTVAIAGGLDVYFLGVHEEPAMEEQP